MIDTKVKLKIVIKLPVDDVKLYYFLKLFLSGFNKFLIKFFIITFLIKYLNKN